MSLRDTSLWEDPDLAGGAHVGVAGAMAQHQASPQWAFAVAEGDSVFSRQPGEVSRGQGPEPLWAQDITGHHNVLLWVSLHSPAPAQPALGGSLRGEAQ